MLVRPVLDAILTTVAVGPRYVALARDLLRSFSLVGNGTLVVTDDPKAFSEPTIAIPCVLDDAPGWPLSLRAWHAKRHALRAGLGLARTVYFLDADNVLHEDRGGLSVRNCVPCLKSLPVGAHACEIIPQGKLAFRGLGRLTEAEPTRLLDRLQASLCAPDWRNWLWWGDWLFALTPGGAGTTFVDAWDRFVVEARAESALTTNPLLQLVLGDGPAMAFAVQACGLVPELHLREFVPIQRAFGHQAQGAWRLRG